MAAFRCDRCGKCCISFGPLIIVERQLSDRDYYCRCGIDKTHFLAHVDADYAEEIAEDMAENIPAAGPEKKPCLFLRKNLKGEGYVCAVYHTRPKICREFRCNRMIISTDDGKVCGRVIGRNTLRTDDPALAGLWKEHIEQLPYGNEAVWIKNVIWILAGSRYRGEPVE